MKFWARQVIRLSDGHSWTGSLQRHHVCMCEHAYMCFSLSLPTTPQVLPFLCFPPPSVQRFPEYWPVAKAGSCCQCTSCVLFLSSRVTMCFARLAIWACTAACPVLWGRPWCQASLPVKTFWVAQNPRHLGWCYGRVTSFIFSPQCYFVLNTIDTPGAFDVKIMKKWNRWTYSIFILAIWFSTIYFGEPSRERSGLFPGISQTLEDKLFSSLPITSAKKCWKAKWKKKLMRPETPFAILSRYGYLQKKVVRCLFHPSLEKALLGSLTLTSWSWFREK